MGVPQIRWSIRVTEGTVFQFDDIERALSPFFDNNHSAAIRFCGHVTHTLIFGSPEARRDLLKTLQACKRMNRTKVRSEEQTQQLKRQIAEMQDGELTRIARGR